MFTGSTGEVRMFSREETNSKNEMDEVWLSRGWIMKDFWFYGKLLMIPIWLSSLKIKSHKQPKRMKPFSFTAHTGWDSESLLPTLRSGGPWFNHVNSRGPTPPTPHQKKKALIRDD